MFCLKECCFPHCINILSVLKARIRSWSYHTNVLCSFLWENTHLHTKYLSNPSPWISLSHSPPCQFTTMFHWGHGAPPPLLYHICSGFLQCTFHLVTRGRVLSTNLIMSLCLKPLKASHCSQDQAKPLWHSPTPPKPRTPLCPFSCCPPAPSFPALKDMGLVWAPWDRCIMSSAQVLHAFFYWPGMRFLLLFIFLREASLHFLDSVKSSLIAHNPGSLSSAVPIAVAPLYYCRCLPYWR